MKEDIESLPTDPQRLQQMVLALQSQVHILTEQNQHLLEQFRLAQQRQFGQSAEGHPGQGELFDEAEVDVDAPEPEKEKIEYERKKPVRKPLPKDLPRIEIVHDIPEEDKVCACCGEPMHRMGEECSEKLTFIPAKIEVEVHIRPKYSCRTCEKTGTEVEIKMAPMPPSPIPKGISTPSLLSQIITNKFQYGLPLYRQESLFNHHGIELSRQTMSGWVIQCAKLFQVLYALLRVCLLKQPVIMADETTLKVIHSDKSRCYMWVYCTGSDAPDDSGIPNIVLYDFQASRGGQCAVDFLAGYDEYLQVDGYAGYHSTQATLVGCWAHARRKFMEAQTAQPKGKTGKANWAINHIAKLYKIEKEFKGHSPEEKHRIRQAQSRPLLEAYKDWLDKSVLQVPPSTALGKAIQYSLNQWEKLSRYIDDGHLSIDNNRAERAVKPFVIGRKNWLFSNTANGAQSSAMLYSIVETAKANGLVPYDYIEHCLTVLCQNPDDQALDTLLPWNVKL